MENNENKTMENKVEEPKQEVALTRQQKIENFLLNPDKEIFNSLQEFNDSINYIKSLVGNLDLDGLDKIQGEDGKSPVLGIDYLTDEDLDKIDAFINDRVKASFSSLPTKEDIESNIENKVASEVAKIPRVKGDKGEDGNDGKNGSPDTAEQILEKLRSLPKNKRINVSDIRGLQAELNRIAQDSETSIEELRDLVNSFRITIPAVESSGGITDINGLITEGANINITGSVPNAVIKEPEFTENNNVSVPPAVLLYKSIFTDELPDNDTSTYAQISNVQIPASILSEPNPVEGVAYSFIKTSLLFTTTVSSSSTPVSGVFNNWEYPEISDAAST